MRNIKLFLGNDDFGKENVLHVAGGSKESPLLLNEIDEAARDQLSEVDFRVWRAGSQKLLRYECYEGSTEFETYGEDD